MERKSKIRERNQREREREREREELTERKQTKEERRIYPHTYRTISIVTCCEI